VLECTLQIKKIYKGLEVLTLVIMKIKLILDVMVCTLVDRYNALPPVKTILTVFLGENIFAHIFTHLISKIVIKSRSLFVTHRWQGGTFLASFN
jgi:hypothetical protein